MKRGKEIKLDLPYSYNVVSGTVDNKNPKSVYLQISAWGKPKYSGVEDYDSIIRLKSKRIKRKLFEILDESQFYKKNSIIDFNMASSGVSYGKKSYMSVEVTLFKKEPLLAINSEEMIPIMEQISKKLISDVLEKDEDFTFYSKKN
jgi:hypothetical protein